MDPYMKQVRRDLKRDKEHFDLLGYVADAQYGIPSKCPCGGTIVDEVAAQESFDMLPEKKYFTCKHYNDDGLHFRQPWVVGVEEEIRALNTRGDKAEKLSWHVYELLRKDLMKLKEEISQQKLEMADLMKVKVEVAQLKNEVADLRKVL